MAKLEKLRRFGKLGAKINEIIDRLEAQKPVPGHGTTVNESDSGTAVSVIKDDQQTITLGVCIDGATKYIDVYIAGGPRDSA